VGPGHACAIRGSTLTCWGSNGGGECGNGPSGSTGPFDVPLPMGAVDVAAGGSHTCVVLADQSIRCFGYNSHGQTTGGAPDGPTQRTPNFSGKKVKALAAGDDHTCAILSDDTVSCWGKGGSGQLGNGLKADGMTPVAVKNLAGVKVIAAGGSRSCAITADNTSYCWGDNHGGELGDGAVMSTGDPGSVIGY
jgi:alpha-tubulin suppressor-like RCC1 family protein